LGRGGGESNRILEDYTIEEILILQDSDNSLIPSDSGLSERYIKRMHQMKWFCQKCDIPLHPGMFEVKYLALK
jgi:hypothetical protein